MANFFPFLDFGPFSILYQAAWLVRLDLKSRAIWASTFLANEMAKVDMLGVGEERPNNSRGRRKFKGGTVHGQNRDDLAVFVVLCFLALGGHCLQMLCLPGFGTHANTQNLPHFRAFPASIQEHSPPKCLFLMVNAQLPNRPAFALLQGGALFSTRILALTASRLPSMPSSKGACLSPLKSVAMKFHGNVRGEVGVISGPFCLETPYFHVWCPLIVQNCSCECSLELSSFQVFVLVPESLGVEKNAEEQQAYMHNRIGTEGQVQEVVLTSIVDPFFHQHLLSVPPSL